MDKVDHKSRDILGGNVEKIAELFPGVVTEAQDEVTGEVKKVVDFDLLRQHLSDTLVEGDRERFRLDWPGKKASVLKANTPITKTLRPVREDSEDFDTTQNIFIEGDNFEVLKVLQESYLGKVKMIYIDPPYNTGKDFIYKDNFAADKGEYEEELGVRDDENGGKLVKNTETNGRYHSDWLSMMQERLIVARDLLTDDGVMFVSIDDNEQAHLKELCDEVFGGNNFITQFIWRRSGTGGLRGTFPVTTHEYVLAYGRDTETIAKQWLAPYTKDSLDAFTNEDEKGKYKTQALYLTSLKQTVGQSYLIEFPDGTKAKPPTGIGSWRFIESTYLKELEAGNIVFKEVSSSPLVLENGSQARYNIYTKQYMSEEGTNPASILPDEIVGVTRAARAELKKLFSKDYFDYAKPVALIKFFLTLVNLDKDDTILDFFSGSGTTAHAVMQLNAEDGGNRKHIQVQLAEPTDPSSEAYKTGYKTIPEISRERIRRAAKKIREDYAEQITKRDTPLDTGFRAYRLSSSNFVDTAQHPNETTQTTLLNTTSNIKDDRSAEDLLTETILDLGLTLDLPIEQRNIAGHAVYFVGGNSLVACFDDTVSLDIVDNIADAKPLRVVFKDSSFADDQTRINIDIRLKQLSPDTIVQVV